MENSGLAGAGTGPLVPDLLQTDQCLRALDPNPAAQFGLRSINDRGDGPAVLYYGTLHAGIRQHKSADKNGRPCRPAGRLAFLQGLWNGTFFVVNMLDGKGQAEANVIAIRAVFIDADTAAAVERLHRFIELSGLEPTVRVASGGVADGVEKEHAYWRIRGCPLDQFTEAQRTLISRIGSDPSICDLPRIMRLPGFWHLKYAPRQTRIITIAPTVEYDFRSEFRCGGCQ